MCSHVLTILTFVACCTTPGSIFAQALSHRCAPGGNFNMKPWELQLPIGIPGSPETISDSSLGGCHGFQNKTYFYTSPVDGSMVMFVPGGANQTGCVTTPNTEFCRTELREVDPKTGDITSWDPNTYPNRLTATVLATEVDNGNHGTIIGQVHVDGNVSQYPVAKLYYKSTGDINLGVEESTTTGGTVFHLVGNVPLRTRFTYEIRYEHNELSVGINGGPQQYFNNTLGAPLSYFKAGNYNQGTTASTIHFYSVDVKH
jgi:hypothetical protein